MCALVLRSAIEHVSHTYQSRKSSGRRSKVEPFPAGEDCAISKANLSQRAGDAGLKWKQVYFRGSLPRTCCGPECTIKHWHKEDNSQLNDVIKCKVTPGDMIKDREKAVY